MTVKGTMIEMTMGDGAKIGVYRVAAQGARRGGVVLIQEIFGVTEHIKEQADRYAAEGYEVLAPALYDREAPGLQAQYTQEDIQRCIQIARQQHPFELSLKDTQVCIDALKGSGKVFSVGYCYGGSVVWAACCRLNGLAAGSAYYGSLVPQFASEQPKCPVICHFGRHDHGIPMEGIDKIKAAHPEVPVYIYEAGHGFASDRRTDYNDEAATLAFQRTLDLFRANSV